MEFIVTFEEHTSDELDRMKRCGEFHAGDGLLLLLLKLAAIPFLLWHKYVFPKLIRLMEPLARWFLTHFAHGFDATQDGGPLLRMAIDIYNAVLFIVLLLCYLIAYAVAVSTDKSVCASIVMCAATAVCMWRIYDLVMFIGLLHSERGYQPYAIVRAMINTIWHYIEIVVCFGVFYIASFFWCRDSFDSDVNSAGLVGEFGNSVYFSLVTIATVGYGDLSPQTTCGKILVSSEVMLGVFLLVIVLQRAMSAGQKLSVEEVIGKLDEKCLALMHSRRQQSFFPAMIDNEGLDESLVAHALDKLVALGILRFDAEFKGLKYAYHWTPLGEEIVRRMREAAQLQAV